ncbi:ISNCY family transposase [Patescibacteria group bacterium]|nr:ISNCY family transposase [Patescibacteria group bacterium]MCG2687434.1 ISNCY family transposase [Candidatus Parcubacteria bacterium]
MEKLLPMSQKQLNKLDILKRTSRKEITQEHAARLLKVRSRTIRRQLNRLDLEGPGCLHHGLIGQPSNNSLPQKEVLKIEKLLKNKYPDFSSTLATEKLDEIHGIKRDIKTIRSIQVRLGLFQPHRQIKKVKHRQWRIPKSTFGELVQFDGSYHDWFEGRGGIKEACLLLAVDDATGKIVHAKFAFHEGVLPVMDFWLEYINIKGIPKEIYLDRFSTYSMNVKLAKENPDTLTQFERVCKEVGMGVVHAYSSQAKGRVERKFKTLQDRLVKEMRLRNICSIQEANEFLVNEYIEIINNKFSVEARHEGDLHRKPNKHELTNIFPYIFCRQNSRVIQNDFTISYKNIWLQILPTKRMAIRPKEVAWVHEMPDESLHVFIRNKKANHAIISKQTRNKMKPTKQLKTLIYS